MSEAFEATTRDQNPYPYYENLHRAEPVVWDEDLHAWLVHDLGLCREVLQHESRFNRADRLLVGGPENKGDPRSLALIDGKEHARLHRLYSQLIDDDRASELQHSCVRPAADELIDLFGKGGRPDLATSYADVLPLSAGFRILGLSPTYDELKEQTRELRQGRWKWNESMGSDAEEARISGESVAALQKLFMPIIREHEDGEGDDLICEIWRRGRELLEDWNEVDAYSLAQTQLGGETPFLLCNLLHILATDPTLQRQLREAPELIPAFVEEGVRAVGPVHYQMRIATARTQLGPTTIGEGDRVLPMLAAANRDPRVFDDPSRIELDRRAIRNHVGFGFGPRYCTGGALARAEAREGISRLLERVPMFELDREAPAPRLAGFHVRSYRPLHVVFST